MKVLVIIPLLNPHLNFFRDTIVFLKNQSVNVKILLISSGGILPDGDYETIVIEKKDFNHANTRNKALEYDADYYLFMTQDATPYDNLLVENLLNTFLQEDVVVSYARQVPYEHADILEKFARTENYPADSIIKSKNDIQTYGIKTFFSSDSCAMYKAAYFQEKGGFKKDLEASEDMEFAARAIFDDKKIAYCAQAKVYHSHSYTPQELYFRYYAIGKFFKLNPWIEEVVVSSESTLATGIKQVSKEFNYLLKNAPLSLPKSLLFNVIKFIAYKRGKN